MFKEKFYHDDLENLAEEVVFEQIYQVIKEGKHPFKQTDVAIQDVAAIALNRMPAKYVCSFLDKRNPRDNYLAEVKDLKEYAKKQVIKAIDIVNQNPHD